VGEYPEPYVAAFLAFQTIYHDGSWGAHRPGYADDIVENALDYMRTAEPLACPTPVAE
jgi:hypothetical protein